MNNWRFRRSSNDFTCLEIAACVRFNSCAAAVKLSNLADASNARSHVSGGRSRYIEYDYA